MSNDTHEPGAAGREKGEVIALPPERTEGPQGAPEQAAGPRPTVDASRSRPGAGLAVLIGVVVLLTLLVFLGGFTAGFWAGQRVDLADLGLGETASALGLASDVSAPAESPDSSPAISPEPTSAPLAEAEPTPEAVAEPTPEAVAELAPKLAPEAAPEAYDQERQAVSPPPQRVGGERYEGLAGGLFNTKQAVAEAGSPDLALEEDLPPLPDADTLAARAVAGMPPEDAGLPETPAEVTAARAVCAVPPALEDCPWLDEALDAAVLETAERLLAQVRQERRDGARDSGRNPLAEALKLSPQDLEEGTARRSPASAPRAVDAARSPVAEVLAESLGPEAAPSCRYRLQVGAFRVADNARELAAELARAGYPAEVVELRAADGGVWRTVRLGWYREAGAAARDADRYCLAHDQDVVVVRKGSLETAEAALTSTVFSLRLAEVLPRQEALRRAMDLAGSGLAPCIVALEGDDAHAVQLGAYATRAEADAAAARVCPAGQTCDIKAINLVYLASHRTCPEAGPTREP